MAFGRIDPAAESGGHFRLNAPNNSFRIRGGRLQWGRAPSFGGNHVDVSG